MPVRHGPPSATITGIADTPCGKLPAESCLSLHDRVARACVSDAGIELPQVDGLLCAYSFTTPHPMLASAVAELLGLRPAYCASLVAGGATAAMMVQTAPALVGSDVCEHVLCVTGDNRLTGMPPGGALRTLAGFGHPEHEVPYGITIPAAYALIASQALHAGRFTLEDLARIAVQTRAHANRHPQAHMHGRELSFEEAMQARVISSPLRLFDCALVSDGAAAVLVSRRATDPARGVAVRGCGQRSTHEHLVAAPPGLDGFGCGDSARQAFAEAGLEPRQIDVAEIYDSFTITLAVELESIGFFPRGGLSEALQDGALELGGALPCNTHGGLLSYGHSGAAGGMFHVVEAVRQLRGEAESRQVAGAETAFVHGDGGVLSVHVSLILGAPA
ncbi:MAG: thiolase family protein [Acidobacteria bacterium]|nr:MAG: thiolase family protein [Acidobacteriota bacterium]